MSKIEKVFKQIITNDNYDDYKFNENLSDLIDGLLENDKHYVLYAETVDHDLRELAYIDNSVITVLCYLADCCCGELSYDANDIDYNDTENETLQTIINIASKVPYILIDEN